MHMYSRIQIRNIVNDGIYHCYRRIVILCILQMYHIVVYRCTYYVSVIQRYMLYVLYNIVSLRVVYTYV